MKLSAGIEYVRKRYAGAHPANRAILSGLIAGSAFVVAGKGISAAKEIIVAYRFGLSAELDAFLFVFNLLSWLPSVALSVATIVVVPALARSSKNDGSNRQFVRELVTLALCLGLLLAVPIAWSIRWLLDSGSSGLPEKSAAIASSFVLPLAWMVPIGLLVSVWTALLLSRGRQVAALLEAMPAATVCVVLLALHTDNINVLLWATLAGSIMQAAALLVGTNEGGGIPQLALRLSSLRWRSISRALAITFVGQALMSATMIVDQFFAARLDPGSVSTLSYTSRLMAFLLGVGGMVISRATLPVFSALGEWSYQETQQLARKWMRISAILGALVAGAMFGWSHDLIVMLFHRGEFTMEHVEVVARAFRFGLVQVPIYFAGMVLVSVMASMRRHVAIAVIAGIVLASKAVGNWVLVPVFGVNGILLSNAVMYAVSVAGSWIVVRRGFNERR